MRQLAARGLDHKLDIAFEPLSSLAIMYIGDAGALA
jgi:hypothetical protein